MIFLHGGWGEGRICVAWGWGGVCSTPLGRHNVSHWDPLQEAQLCFQWGIQWRPRHKEPKLSDTWQSWNAVSNFSSLRHGQANVLCSSSLDLFGLVNTFHISRSKCFHWHQGEKMTWGFIREVGKRWILLANGQVSILGSELVSPKDAWVLRM